MTDEHIPEGFACHERHSPLTAPWEPIYSRRAAGAVHLGFRGGAPHANSRGFIHGGLITALADNAMGLSCAEGRADVSSLVTVNLTIDFVGPARLGQWIEIRPEVLKTGKSLCFTRALITADDSVCARASGVFMVVGKS